MSDEAILPAWLDQHRILNVKQLAVALDYSVPHLRRLYRAGKIPKPISIGGRKLGWPAATVVALTTLKKENRAA